LTVQSGQERRWLRPGKKGRSWSATTGVCRGKDGADLLRVFSSNAAPFEDGHAYGKFRAYVLLNHHGHFDEAARELGRQGYGSALRAPGRPAQDPAAGERREREALGQRQGLPTDGQADGQAAPSGEASRAEPRPPLAQPPEAPRTGTQIIVGHFWHLYRPLFKDGNAIRCADGRTVFMTEACAVADTPLIQALAGAVNAPTYKGGGLNYNALPGFFKTWARVAWGDLLNALPEEDDAELAGLEPARDEFRRLVRDAMLTEVVLGEVITAGRDQQTRVERRSLIGWCQRFAKVGPWRQIRDKQCWCKLVELPDAEIVFRVAIRHGVFAQLKADRRLVEMPPKKFTRRAARYEVGTSTEGERPHGKVAIVLADDLVADMVDSLLGKGEEICATSKSASAPPEVAQKTDVAELT
jgi:hypothetical protein